MDLLKYLEPMKNLPKRFSNLAFWRDVRKFKDEVVNAFEYVDSWGENIEHSIINFNNAITVSYAVKLTDIPNYKSIFNIAPTGSSEWSAFNPSSNNPLTFNFGTANINSTIIHSSCCWSTSSPDYFYPIVSINNSQTITPLVTIDESNATFKCSIFGHSVNSGFPIVIANNQDLNGIVLFFNITFVI